LRYDVDEETIVAIILTILSIALIAVIAVLFIIDAKDTRTPFEKNCKIENVSEDYKNGYNDGYKKDTMTAIELVL
jgi:hypothetical protein